MTRSRITAENRLNKGTKTTASPPYKNNSVRLCIQKFGRKSFQSPAMSAARKATSSRTNVPSTIVNAKTTASKNQIFQIINNLYFINSSSKTVPIRTAISSETNDVFS